MCGAVFVWSRRRVLSPWLRRYHVGELHVLLQLQASILILLTIIEDGLRL